MQGTCQTKRNIVLNDGSEESEKDYQNVIDDDESSVDLKIEAENSHRSLDASQFEQALQLQREPNGFSTMIRTCSMLISFNCQNSHVFLSAYATILQLFWSQVLRSLFKS